ncbi:MAG: hypothetical protein QGG48_00140 [Desulfatiglandales bacterium]|nr:hypothetical protein [Desulfatiglandales bacterium]
MLKDRVRYKVFGIVANMDRAGQAKASPHAAALPCFQLGGGFGIKTPD